MSSKKSFLDLLNAFQSLSEEEQKAFLEKANEQKKSKKDSKPKHEKSELIKKCC